MPEIGTGIAQFEVSDADQIRALVHQGANSLQLRLNATDKPVFVALRLEVAYTYQPNDPISLVYFTDKSWQVDTCVKPTAGCPDFSAGCLRQSRISRRSANLSRAPSRIESLAAGFCWLRPTCFN